jgi:hypothetical protein
MTRFMNSLGAAVIAGAALLATSSAQAQTVRVNFSLLEETETVEMSNGLDADVTLDPNPGDFVDLTPGVTETNVFLSGGDVDLFQGSNASGSGTLQRLLTASIGSGTPDSESLSQGITITTTSGSPPFVPASADVFISSGSPAVYDLGGYQLTVTPRSFSRTGQTSTNIPINNSADFLLQVVPEPTSGLLVIAGAGLLMTRRQRRA